MYSFYGGRPGNSFIIIKSFDKISDMVAAFQEGPDYTDVHYDEYVIINTIDKNSADNGKIYRRGYDFQNAEGGAEYIGTIVGPAGGSPEVSMATEAEIEQIYQQYEDNQGFDKRFSNGSYTLTNHSLVPGKQGNTFHDEISWHCCSLRDAETKTNTIAYIGFTVPYPVIDFEAEGVDPYTPATTIKLPDEESDPTAVHPFYDRWKIQIPKGIKGDTFKNLQVITADEDDGVELYGDSDEQREDRENHRQILIYEYHNYDDSAEGESKKIYLGDYNMIEDINLQEDGSIIINYTHDKEVQLRQILKWLKDIQLDETGNLIFTYNTKTIDPQTGEVSNEIKTFNSVIKSIKDIKLENGTLTFIYNTQVESEDGEGNIIIDNQKKIFPNAIKTIASISDDRKNNVFTITYTDGSQDTISDFTWVKRVFIASTGQIITELSDGTQRWSDGTYSLKITKNGITTIQFYDAEGNPIQTPNQSIPSTTGLSLTWIDGAELDEQGYFKLHWNYQTDNEFQILNDIPIKWIDNINLDSNGNDLTITYNTIDQGVQEAQTFNNIFRRISQITLNDQKEIVVNWSDGSSETLNSNKPLSSISDVAVDTSGNFLVEFSPPRDHINYNNKNNWTYIGTFGTENFNLNETSATIDSNNFFSGILDNHDLYFSISTTQLISKLVQSTNVTDGQITVYRVSTGEKIIQNLNLVGNNTFVTTDLSGIRFRVDEALSEGVIAQESEQTAIPIFIQVNQDRAIRLGFNLNDAPNPATISWQERMERIEDAFDKVNIPEMKIYLFYKNGIITEQDYYGLPTINTMGDCFLISSGATTILVDGTNAEYMQNLVADKIQSLVQQGEVSPITHVIISHYHIDHIEGFNVLLNPANSYLRTCFDGNCQFFLPQLPNNNFISADDPEKGDVLSIIQSQANTFISLVNSIWEETNHTYFPANFTKDDKTYSLINYPNENETVVFDPELNPHFSVRFLNCGNTSSVLFEDYYTVTSYNDSINIGTRYNNFSLVTEFTHGNVIFLSPGDIEPAAQHRIAPLITESPTIYKVEHHTFTHKTDEDYLKKINPEIAFILGRNDTNLNQYSRSETINHLVNATNAILVGEDLNQDMTCIISNGENVSVTGDGIINKGYVLASPGQKIAYDFEKARNNIPISLNDYKVPGTYYATGAQTSWTFLDENQQQTIVTQRILEAPFEIYFKLIVCSIFDASSNINIHQCVQIAISRQGEIAIRSHRNANWTNWQYMVAFPKETTWINNFTPSSDWIYAINNNIIPFVHTNITDPNNNNAFTLKGNFVTTGMMSSTKKMIYCNIPIAQGIDSSKYKIKIKSISMKAFQNGQSVWGGDHFSNFVDNDTYRINAWLTSFGLSLQLSKKDDTTFGNSVANSPVSIEFGSSTTGSYGLQIIVYKRT